MSEDTTPVTATVDRATVLAGIGWVLTGVTLAVYHPGVAVATLLFGIALRRVETPVAGYAAAQVGIAAVVPPVPAAVATAQLGPAVLLVALVPADSRVARTLGVGAILTVLLGGVTLSGLFYTGSILIAGGALLGTIGLVGYAIHRYELITLGLLEGEYT